MTLGRPRPALADERATLAEYAALGQRLTLELKCAGPRRRGDGAAAPSEPSTMSLLGPGAVTSTEVERGVRSGRLAGRRGRAPALLLARGPGRGLRRRRRRPRAVVAEAWAAVADRGRGRRRAVRGQPTPQPATSTGEDRWRGSMSLREVMVEMLHEYARHLGHADLLRERIDGRIGQ